MAIKPLSRSVSIIGIGTTKFGDPSDTPELAGMSLQDLGVWACAAAMEDAGVNPQQIGKLTLGMVCSPYYNSECMTPISGFMEFVGMKGKAGVYHNEACASGMNCFNEAVEAVASGRYDIAICVDSDSVTYTQAPNQPSCYRYPANEYKKLYGHDWVGPVNAIDTAYGRWNGGNITQTDANTRHYLKLSGITPEELEDAFVGQTVTARQHGKLNPNAYRRTTWEEVAKKRGFDNPKAYLTSKYNVKLTEYLRPGFIFVGDEGAAAVIVCATEIAGQFRQKPIEVVNYAQVTMGPTTPAVTLKLTRSAIKELYEVSGYKPEDIEYLEAQDADPIVSIDSAEAVGYLPKGEGWKYFRDGRTRFDKEKPINTCGGWSSVGHANAATTVAAIGECVLQMRGQAGERQIPKPPKVSMMLGHGGAQSMTIAIFKALESGDQKKQKAEPPKFKPEPVVKMFYEGLDQGKFLGMKCPKCGYIEFPPYPICNRCGNVGNQWLELSGDVTINEVYKTNPAFVTAEFAMYAPVFGAEVAVEGGSEHVSLIFGVTPESYEKVRDSVPLKGKLVVLPMEDYNTYAVSINGAVPKPKEGC